MTVWHVEAPVWTAYAAGTLDPAAEASVETHVAGCAECRAAARAYAAPAPGVWEAVQATITRPRLPRPLRPLRRLGIPEGDLVVIGASDAITVSWAVAVAGALASVLATTLAGVRQELAFLLLVPLVPVLSVVAAFDATDSLREVAEPTPVSKLRVALLRASAALAIAVPATAAIGFVVPGLGSLTSVWLLPSLGLVLAALVLHTWLDAWVAAGVVSAVWVGVVSSVHSELDTVTAQLLFAALAAALAVVLVLRTTTLKLGGAR